MGDLIVLLVSFGTPLLFLLAGYAVGKTVENKHIQSLVEREANLTGVTITNLKTVHDEDLVVDRFYVDAQAVIGSDYFKTFAMKMRNIFGGELRSMQMMMMRARREAMVRMTTKALEKGATHICNVRYETSTIARGTRKKAPMPTAEIHVYGTAVRYRTPD